MAVAGLGGPGPGRASLLALVPGWGVGAPGGYLAGAEPAGFAALLLAGGVWLGARPARIGVRVLASWIGALGLLLIGWQLRGVGAF